MATNSLGGMPSTGIATPYAWEVRDSLHDTNLERHPNFIEGLKSIGTASCILTDPC